MEYIKENPLETEETYPYKAKGQKCAYNRSQGVVSDNGAVAVKP